MPEPTRAPSSTPGVTTETESGRVGFPSELGEWAASELSDCCSDCTRYAKPGPHRLERWRFAALKRLVKAKRIPRDQSRYRFTPLEAATELALLLDVPPPACRGGAWAFLKAQYDPRVTPPHKSTKKADRRRQRRH